MRWRKGSDAEPPPDQPALDGLETEPTAADIEAGLTDSDDRPDTQRVARGLNGDDEAIEGASDQPAGSPTDASTEEARPEPADAPPADAVSDDDFADEPSPGDAPVEGEQVVADEPSADLVSSGPLYLAYVATSHVGNIRKNNQDSGYASGNLLVVADGMGGAAAGDLASAVAIESISKVDRRVEGEDMLAVLAEAIRKANDKIADLVADDHALEGMGTTVSGALFDGTEIGLAHIGDSRGYLLRDGELRQLTHDHSWVQSLIDDGKITEEEAAYHPHRSLLLRVLNGQPANDPDLSMLTIAAGDRLLFCSDGLCGFVTDDVIGDHLAIGDRDAARDALLDEALAAGGLDNITIVLADVIAHEPTEVPAPLMLGAATEVDIPHVDVAPRVIDLGDDEDTPHRSAKPAAPAPRSSGADETERYAPIKPPRWRWLRRVVLACVVVLVLLGLGGAGLAWSRTQYYLGPDEGQVAIYQGLPDRVPLLPTSRLYEVQDIKITDLPPFFADQVTSNSIVAPNLERMRQSVTQLRTAAQKCVEQRQSPTPRPSTTPKPTPPSASPSSTTSASPSGTTSASPSGTTSASPSGTPSASPSGSASPGPDGTC